MSNVNLSREDEMARVNERMAAIRANPSIRYAGAYWRDLEMEQQAECRRYVSEGLLKWEGSGRDCRVVSA